jgi:hypothetical protein
MPKYYIESGKLQVVVHAKNSRGAALWAVHRSLASLLPFMSESARHDGEAEQNLAALGESISASERGFGRSDAEEFDTFEIVTEWNQLMVALDRLETLTPALSQRETEQSLAPACSS